MAAKQKTKRGPIETTCTETAPGRWEFATGKYNWLYETGMGVNLYARIGDAGFTGVIYTKNLDHAVMFAQGYEAGCQSK